MNLNEKIYVISIIGRQSSGKSYLLNRLFGTRFTVAASRCTDGIWASIVELEQTKFLILDCEGLFSPQRTKNEETYLLAFLAAVCDVTILN
jgi:GTPase Era involved in 16S rRNA processing